MSISLKPLGNRVVVEPIEQEDVTAGGRNSQRETPEGQGPRRGTRRP